MWKAPLAALLLQLALGGVAALLVRRVKPAALVLGAAAFLVAPWLAGPIPFFRGTSALLGFILFFRIIDLARFREKWSAWRRVLHVASFVDSRTLRRASPRVDFLALGRALLWAALAVAAWHVADSPRQLVRWGGGLVFVYAALESGYAAVFAAYRVAGFVTPRLHVSPIASISVAELWGTRWARPVSNWLRETCFRPLARRGHPGLGVALGFVVSAIGHAYAILVGVGLPMASLMFAFFVVQCIFVLAEARLGAPRWPRPARRAWTVAIMVASSPLFVEPALRALGLP